MSLVSPERLLWLLIAIPIVMLYILRTRLRRQPVATLLFWDQLFDQKRQRSWWQRLRHWLSLLLQLAFLLLVVGALADPLWTGQGDEARQVVIVIDNSASMAAASGGGSTRFERARQEALGVVAGLRDGDEVALVTAGSSVRVPVGMTDFTPVVRDAIGELTLTDGPSRVNEAIDAAKRLTQSPEHRRIVVISDACFQAADELAGQGDVDLVTVGTSQDNVGITSLAVRRSLVDPIGYAALIEVENFGESATEARLMIELADELVDVIPLSLAPDESWSKTVTGASAAGGVLRVGLDHDDALAIDNQALAVLPERPRIPVQLVTAEPSLYLESVLNAIPLIDLTVTATPPQESPEGGFTLLHRVVPETLPGGAVFVIDPKTDSDAWTLGRSMEQAIVATQDPSSPLLPHVSLTNVMLPGARELQLVDEAHPLLVEAGGGTLMASLVRGDDRIVVLAADLDSSDLPLRIAFPVLMTNAVNWFLGRTGELQPSLHTGELAEIPIGAAGEEEWAWVDASGHVAPASVTGEQAVVGPVDRVGLLNLGRRRDVEAVLDADAPGSGGEPQSAGAEPATPASGNETIAEDVESASRTAPVLLAVNLCDRNESDLRPRGEVSSETVTVAGVGRRSLWFYLACLGLGLIVAEWFLYQRRIVG